MHTAKSTQQEIAHSPNWPQNSIQVFPEVLFLRDHDIFKGSCSRGGETFTSSEWYDGIRSHFYWIGYIVHNLLASAEISEGMTYTNNANIRSFVFFIMQHSPRSFYKNQIEKQTVRKNIYRSEKKCLILSSPRKLLLKFMTCYVSLIDTSFWPTY